MNWADVLDWFSAGAIGAFTYACLDRWDRRRRDRRRLPYCYECDQCPFVIKTNDETLAMRFNQMVETHKQEHPRV